MKFLSGKFQYLICAAILLSMLIAAFCLCFHILPLFVEDPMLTLEQQYPSQVWTNERGEWIFTRRGYDYQWRFEKELSGIAPVTLRTLLAVEDRNFYQHSGFDVMAFFRAVIQNVKHLRIISGASTITMQLAGMTEQGGRRSLWRKIRQFLKARRLEQLYSKDRILKEYCNRLPFGGKLYGFESAARFYFGMSASDLNQAESALLCGLPQRPNGYRPDRFMDSALKRRDRVLLQMVRNGVLSGAEAEKIRLTEPLRFRDFSYPADFQRLAVSPDQMYFDEAAAEAGESFLIPCAYDPELSRLLRNELLAQVRFLNGVQDGAGVLIENETGRIVAMVGTLYHTDVPGYLVNAAKAIRSAGSSLKPFVYAEAIGGGMIVSDSVLIDLPLRYADYAPGNYSGDFLGEVTASKALSLSLNIPAVRLLAQVGVPRMIALFRKIGIFKPEQKTDGNGLSLILGTGGHTLLAIASAYRIFALDGLHGKSSYLLHCERKKERVFPVGTGRMTAAMLRSMPLPDCVHDVAWKTGTSNGNRDAWCFAFTPEWTLGVWLGNKDGRASAALVGTEAAAPVAGRIMNMLYQKSSRPAWVDFPESLQQKKLCQECGLTASADCKKGISGTVLRSVPLRRCQCHENRPADRKINILTPLPGIYQADQSGYLEVILSARSTEEPHWFLNDQYLGKFKKRELRLLPGRYFLKALSEEDGIAGSRLEFEVETAVQSIP